MDSGSARDQGERERAGRAVAVGPGNGCRVMIAVVIIQGSNVPGFGGFGSSVFVERIWVVGI
jgi:hypothetical protein